MDPPSSPSNAFHPIQASPSPQRTMKFSTPPLSFNISKDPKWINEKIGKKEYKSLFERGLQTVSKKLRFEESTVVTKENSNNEGIKILKLR